eukprot:TRINITY_DN22731_c0_g1_i3.p1 TRINITY_DN22731_c0_g1~~TRINITY_DN22731_c0_g1_i3.p1  ORF type:complete len:129 (+),score=33.29 TRINITY_DN22731_c0_g1_i3:71-457(+)
MIFFFFFQAEDGIRDAQESRGLGDVYKRQVSHSRMSSVCCPIRSRWVWWFAPTVVALCSVNVLLMTRCTMQLFPTPASPTMTTLATSFSGSTGECANSGFLCAEQMLVMISVPSVSYTHLTLPTKRIV